MTKKRDEVSVETSRNVLEALGCPDARLGEGSDEWGRSKGRTGSRRTSSQDPLSAAEVHPLLCRRVRAKRRSVREPPRRQCVGRTHAVGAVAENRTVNIDDFGDTGEQLVKPMNDKLRKYVGARKSTPMFGLAMYFTMTGDQYVGPIIAGIQALNTLDRIFGIEAHSA